MKDMFLKSNKTDSIEDRKSFRLESNILALPNNLVQELGERKK